MSRELAHSALAAAFGAAGGAVAEITKTSLKVAGTWPNITKYYD